LGVVLVMRRLRSTARPDRGFTLVELSVAGLLSTIVVTAVVLMFNSLSQNAADARQQAEIQAVTRDVADDMAAELRAAVPARPGDAAVDSLSNGSLVFYTSRYGGVGPVKVVYERTNCSAGVCSLRERRYPVVSGSGPNWQYSTTASLDSILLPRVADGYAMFSGIKWSGTPLARTTVSSCGGSTRCDFPLVAVDLRVVPPTTSKITTPFILYQEVELRNV
jgi:Tfp pilus assembly protein PilW